ncbi:transposase [Mesobacillus sp. LC4]
MGRKLKTWSPEYFYHVVSRGNRREPLFLSSDDFEAFLYILLQTYEKFPFEITSYCLMTNHYHIQIRTEAFSISKVMSIVNKRYANYFNNKYNQSGHVFEKRYFDQVILGPVGMYEVSRYIHMNPVRAHIVERPEDYPWSSYRFYLNPMLDAPEFLKVEVLINSVINSFRGNSKKVCTVDFPPLRTI